MGYKLHAYDEDVKWQLAEPGAFMNAKVYQDKKALPLVEKLKEVVKLDIVKLELKEAVNEFESIQKQADYE